MTQPYGTVWYGYDLEGRLDRIDHSGPTGVIDFYDYGHDPAGNRTSMTSAAGVETYTLDLIKPVDRGFLSRRDEHRLLV